MSSKSGEAKLLKRRQLLALSGLGGIGIALGGHSYLSSQYPLKNKICPRFDTHPTKLLSSFAAVGDVGTGDNYQYAVAKTMSCFFAMDFSFILMVSNITTKELSQSKVQLM